MKASQILVMILMLLVFVGANFYVFYRIWRMVPPSATAARIAVIVCGIVLAASFFLGMAGRWAGMPDGLTTLFYRVGTSWVFIFLYLLIIFLIADLLRVTHLLPMDKIMYGNWLSLGALAGFLAVVFIAGNINYHNKRRVELDIKVHIEKPIKVVAASDLHIGYGVGKKELAKWVDMINREKPDAVLIAGDLIDNGTRRLWEKDYASELRRIDATYGVFIAPGNHEYISGIDESLRFLENAGITVLRDSVVLLDNDLYIIGRDDMTNGHRKSVAELTKELRDSIPTLLLDHQPYHLEEAEQAGIDLQISGHTHRGQVWPVSWITDALFERSHGYLRKGDTQYYVSSGLGIWGGKFRIGSKSDYIVVNFEPELE